MDPGNSSRETRISPSADRISSSETLREGVSSSGAGWDSGADSCPGSHPDAEPMIVRRTPARTVDRMCWMMGASYGRLVPLPGSCLPVRVVGSPGSVPAGRTLWAVPGGGHQVGGCPLTARATNEMTSRIRKTTKRIWAMPAEAPAMPEKPRTPATSASRKKISAQPNMWLSLVCERIRISRTASAETPGGQLCGSEMRLDDEGCVD